MTQTQLDWDRIEKEGSGFVKLEANISAILGFGDIKIIETTMEDKETKQKKKLLGIQLKVNHYDGKPVELTLNVFSKRFMALIRPQQENGNLVKKLWKVTKVGSGFQTNYTMIPVRDNPQVMKIEHHNK